MRSILQTLASTLALATAASAACSALGPGASDSFSGPFHITARSASGTVTALQLVNFLTPPMTSYHAFATSGPTYGWTGLVLSGGVITTTTNSPYTAPVHSIGAVSVSPSYPVPNPGPWPTWSSTWTAPSELFCAVPDPAGSDTILAMSGHTDLFSLCSSWFSSSVYYTTALLFNASSTYFSEVDPGYDGSTCVPVTIGIVPN